MTRKIYLISSLFVIAFGVIPSLSGCGSGTDDQQKETTDAVGTDSMVPEKKGGVFYSMPSPLQLAKMLQKSGAIFDKSALNDPSKTSNYSTTTSKALNLGVYAADMSYSAIYNQTQEMMSYLDAAKKLADDLGSAASFSQAIIKRLKTNAGNKDSSMSIISEIFLSSNETFKENGQENVYVLALAGGFSEGLYLATQSVKKNKNNDAIVTRIAELKGSLNNLLFMLDGFSSDKTVAEILKDFQEIKSVYDEMNGESSATATVQADTTAKKGTIGGNSKYTLSKEQLDKITSKVEALRTKIIK